MRLTVEYKILLEDATVAVIEQADYVPSKNDIVIFNGTEHFVARKEYDIFWNKVIITLVKVLP